MAQVITTNMASLNAQRNLTTNQSSLATALQRLSSGLRINSAKDDAAGLAIADRMTTQIRGLNQAARNANDGISLAQTAEGALNEVGNNLQRLRELAVQSANATNSASDRVSLQAEASQLIAEIDRVATQTSFNSVNLLNGTFTNQAFQVGANANQTISITSIASARTSALGQSYGASIAGTTLTAATGVTGAGQFTVQLGTNTAVDIFSASGSATILGSAKDLAAAVNTSNISGLTATAAATVSAAGTYTATTITGGTAVLTVNGIDMNVVVVDQATANVTAAFTAVNANSAATGVTATQSGNLLTLTAADGRNIITSIAAGTSTDTVLATVGLGGLAATYGSYSLAYSGTATVTIAGTAAAGVKGVAGTTGTPVVTNATATGTAVSAVNISTVAGATAAIASLDAALATINTSRGSLGAYQNRFSSAIANLMTTSENVTAARSRIQDADFAAETAQLTRGQILQQAGVAMLAQANSLPNTVLALLRG